MASSLTAECVEAGTDWPTSQERNDNRFIQAALAYGNAVMHSTKADGQSKGWNKRERVAARVLLKVALGRNPTEDEVESLIPG